MRRPPRPPTAARPLAAGLALCALAACSRGAPPAPAAPAEAALATGAGSTRPAVAAPPVRPPFRCLSSPEAPLGSLLSEAEGAIEVHDHDRALGCADEALRRAPRSVRALAVRGQALAGLDRLPEAQLAYARALALEPDDPRTLAAAAELHVHRFDGAHDALEAGLAEAERGLRAITRVPRRDHDLALRLELAAAAALDDLGRPQDALAHADRALAIAPADPSARTERGVALFERCRFDEARAAFESVLAVSPGDPWALHHLGLLAERRGDFAVADKLLGEARAKSPADFPPGVSITPEAFRDEVARAVEALPVTDRAALRGVPVEARDLPTLDDLTGGEAPLSPTILGLFRGPPLGEACGPGDADPCRSIALYRRNLARAAPDRAELDRQIRVTLTHELGHLRGEDDDALRDRGLQ
jgi:Flp pilus assembly protein TadD/predicted Zn-dependent protease with MMP-like domain